MVTSAVALLSNRCMLHRFVAFFSENSGLQGRIPSGCFFWRYEYLRYLVQRAIRPDCIPQRKEDLESDIEVTAHSSVSTSDTSPARRAQRADHRKSAPDEDPPW